MKLFFHHHPIRTLVDVQLNPNHKLLVEALSSPGASRVTNIILLHYS